MFCSYLLNNFSITLHPPESSPRPTCGPRPLLEYHWYKRYYVLLQIHEFYLQQNAISNELAWYYIVRYQYTGKIHISKGPCSVLLIFFILNRKNISLLRTMRRHFPEQGKRVSCPYAALYSQQMVHCFEFSGWFRVHGILSKRLFVQPSSFI